MFDYRQAFSRNIGWVTDSEQQILKGKRVAIAGMGGVGGEHLLTLARLGISRFNISDFDEFEIHNFNRQAGASLGSIDRAKVAVMQEMVLAINPDTDVRAFPQGTTKENINEFLEDVDIYVDSLDFFALEARKLLFRSCEEREIPIVTAAPLGMGTSVLCFMPGKMGFDEYFQLDGKEETDQLVNFLIGLSPSFLQKGYLVEPGAADFHAKKGPSMPMAVKMCAGVAGTTVLKILLNRGDVVVAPWSVQYDAYTNKMTKVWRPFGNKNPLQKLTAQIVRKIVTNAMPDKTRKETQDMDLLDQILDVAKWAPSGDNTQPWCFEKLSSTSFKVHGFDTRNWVVYDLQGRASQLAIGCLLENISIAAAEHGFSTKVEFEEGCPEDKPTFIVNLEKTQITRDDLYAYVKERTVQRRPMGTRMLSEREKQILESSLPKGYSLIWLEGGETKFTVARLMFGNAYTRLSMEEGFNVHSKIIEWNADTSEDKIPDRSLGLDWLTLKLMRWSLGSWKRFDFVARYLAGTLMPRILLDFIPSLACSAHFVLLRNEEAMETKDYVEAGRALQRFWLTCTQLNLGFQPEQTPIIFSEYLRRDVSFSRDERAQNSAKKMDTAIKSLIGEENLQKAVFMGRVGRTTKVKYRSVRKNLKALTQN